MADLRDPRWIVRKGMLFLVLGLLSAALLVIERPAARTAALLAVCVWSFCRFYYFAFYVLERYVDPAYRYAGLISLAKYLITKRFRRQTERGRTRESPS